MKTYIGTKIINAKPMTRQAYNDFRGWQLPADEDGNDEGYLVEYHDGGQANTTSYAGYVSWSPKEQFEKAHLPIGDVKGMPPHQQRVVAELAELNEKLTKLLAFFQSPIFGGLHEVERDRLQNQARFMDGYAAILQQRVAAFKEVLP